jgi:peptide/nickel transport system permease protein
MSADGKSGGASAPGAAQQEPISAAGRRRRAILKRLLKKPGFVFGIFVLVPLVLVAVFAPQIAPYPPDMLDPGRFQPPLSPGHLLGTDNLGRDILSRLIYGARLSLLVGVVVIGIGASVGSLLGVTAGYFGGVIDNVIMRVTDMLLAFPDILLALMVITVLGPGLFNVMIALGVASIPGFTRLVRSTTLEVRELEFVEASRALGNRSAGLLLRHVLPNVFQPVLVVASLGVATAILAAAGLSFIGLGAPPGAAEWGAMLNDARTYMRRAWWMATMPGVTITLAVLAISLLGEALREAFDPKLG